MFRDNTEKCTCVNEGSDALDLEGAGRDHDDEHDVEDGIGQLQVTSTDRLRDHS